MGHYTQFHFRARIKPGEISKWFQYIAMIADEESNPLGTLPMIFDDHKFFDTNSYWWHTLTGQNAAYQIAQPIHFEMHDRGGGDLLIMSSSKDNLGSVDSFIDFVTPFVDGLPGDFLGYSLYEEGRLWETRCECPALYFLGRPRSLYVVTPEDNSRVPEEWRNK